MPQLPASRQAAMLRERLPASILLRCTASLRNAPGTSNPKFDLILVSLASQYSIFCILQCRFLGSSFAGSFREGTQVDSQLLRFLVEVAALQAERLGCVGHVEMIAFQFRQDDFALKALGALG